MPIDIKKLGNHDGVMIADFGTGDIQIIKCKESTDSPMTSILLRQHSERHEIGEDSNEFVDKSSDDVPSPQCLIRFSNVESLDVMIESLQDLRKSMSE